MAAIRAGQLRQDVTLLEKNPILGKKILLSGKGRCNLTNTCDLSAFFRRFSRNGQFLRDAFNKFFNQDLMRFFTERGLKLKVERQGRVFPQTDKSGSIVEVLRKELLRNKVNILYNSCVKSIEAPAKAVKGIFLEDGRFFPGERIILATGGVSYAFTGSTGEGLIMAQRLGHKIAQLRPGLVPLRVAQGFPRALSGLTLKNIRLEFSDGEKHILSEIGELLFTDFGISGPLVLSLSGKIVDWLLEEKEVFVEIDLKPALSREQVSRRLHRDFQGSYKKGINNVLKNSLPKRLISVFLELAKINPDKKVNQVTREELSTLISLFKGLRLDIQGALPIEEAMVSRGGVSLKEINPRTMESRLIKGLYFAGEMIDLDADTGGFNLQAAFSTGYLAGESASLSPSPGLITH